MLENLFDTYCREKRILEGKSELTIKSYQQAFKRYQKAVGDQLPTENPSVPICRVRARRVTFGTFPHSPLQTGRALFKASGFPSVGLTLSFAYDN